MGKTYVKVNGTWKLVDKTYIKVDGIWKACNKVYIKVSGIWKDVTGMGDRGVFGGGYNFDGNKYQDIIDYITISSLGNAQDFGNLTVGRNDLAATSNGINDRGVFGGGYNPDDDNYNPNTIDYITISSLGNAQDFGDLTVGRRGLAATSNGINDRGVFGGHDNTIDYITISSLGNAQDFGDLTVGRNTLAATSNGINDRGVFGGGWVYSNNKIIDLNTIDYITISSLGNAQDFGDLTVGRSGTAATSNGINDRGVFGGGCDSSYYDNFLNIIDYITISSLGNAQDFGDLTAGRDSADATSDA